MGSPTGGSRTGKQVAKLPAPEYNDRLPWPYFAVDPAVRAMVITAQRVPTITLGPLGAAVLVVAPPTAAPMAIPVNAKRIASPSSTGAPSPHPAAPPRPQHGPALAAQPAPATVGAAPAAAPVVVPRRTAGPQGTAGASTPTAGPVAGLPPMVSYPSGTGSYAISVPPPPKMRAPVRGAMAGSPASRRAVSGVQRLGTASLVLGLLGIVLPLIAGIPAIICGHLALRRADPVWTPERLKRRAQWGLALGYLSSLSWLGYLLLVR